MTTTQATESTTSLCARAEKVAELRGLRDELVDQQAEYLRAQRQYDVGSAADERLGNKADGVSVAIALIDRRIVALGGAV